MVDDHDRDALLLQPSEDLPELSDLFLSQRRRRLVQDQQLCVVDDRPADGNHLLAGDRQLLQRHIRVQLRTDLRHTTLCDLMDLLPVHKFLPVLDFPVQCDVLRDCQVRKYRKILVNDLNPAVDGVDGFHVLHLLAVDPDLALVRLMNPRDCLDQRGLPAAILTGQAVDLAFPDLQVNASERMDTAERLLDPLKFQKYLVLFISHILTRSFLFTEETPYGF